MEEKMALVIEANRDGYSIDQCGDSITVGELTDILNDYDSETRVYVSNDNGYTYGSISMNDIGEKYEEKEVPYDDEEENNESINESSIHVDMFKSLNENAEGDYQSCKKMIDELEKQLKNGNRTVSKIMKIMVDWPDKKERTELANRFINLEDLAEKLRVASRKAGKSIYYSGDNKL